MDVNNNSRKTNLMLVLIILNTFAVAVTALSHFNHVQWAKEIAAVNGQFQESVIKYRDVSEKLQEERWANLMNRLDAFESKLNDKRH